MAISTTSPVHSAHGICTNFIDTDENWAIVNPITIPGMFYISSDGINESSFKIGDGRRWSDIEPFKLNTDGVPVGTLIFNLSTTTPPKYLPLNGALLSREDYNELFAFANTSGMIVSDDVWNDNITYKGCFTYGTNNTNFRIPLLDDITLEAWSTDTGNNPGRSPGMYQRGTLIGTDYFFGQNQSSPYISFFNYGLSIMNGMTTDNCPTDIKDNNITSNIYTYAQKVSNALVGRYDELAHPELTDLMNAISLDNPNYQDGYQFNSPMTGNIFPSNQTHSVTRIIGMARCESVAYPVYIKYTSE